MTFRNLGKYFQLICASDLSSIAVFCAWTQQKRLLDSECLLFGIVGLLRLCSSAPLYSAAPFDFPSVDSRLQQAWSPSIPYLPGKEGIKQGRARCRATRKRPGLVSKRNRQSVRLHSFGKYACRRATRNLPGLVSSLLGLLQSLPSLAGCREKRNHSESTASKSTRREGIERMTASSG
jgi:hypothetical protein